MRVDDILGKAEAFRARSRYSEALRLYSQALRGLKGEKRLECLMSMGDTCRMTGRFTGAEKSYKTAVELASRLKEPSAANDAAVGLALSKRALGDWEGSLSLLGRAEKGYRKASDIEGLAFTLWARGGALRVKGDIAGALAAFMDAKRIFVSIGDDSGTGYSLCGLGGASRIKGLFAGSLKYYGRAYVIFKGLGDSFGIAYSRCGIGNALRMKGDFRGAMEHFRRAVALYRRMGDTVSSSYTLWSMGKTHMMTGRTGLSGKYFREAMVFFRKTMDPRGIIYCRMGLAELRYLAGDVSGARRMLASAHEEARSYRFAVEECHSSALLGALDAKGVHGCYRRLGLGLRFKSIPFNIP